jgi:hypothetical protein
LVINLSLSLVDGLKSSEALGLKIRIINSTKLNDGVEGVYVTNANDMEFIHMNVHP